MLHLRVLALLSCFTTACTGTNPGSGSETEADPTTASGDSTGDMMSTAASSTATTGDPSSPTVGTGETTSTTSSTNSTDTTGTTANTSTSSTTSEGTSTGSEGSSTDGTSTATTELADPDGVTLCTLSEELPHAGTWTNPTMIRLAPSGDALYVTTGSDELRRYIIADDEACALTLDPNFGVVEVYASSLGVDLSGAVYTTHHGSSSGVRRVSPMPEIECQPKMQVFSLGVETTGAHRVGRTPEGYFRFTTAGDDCGYEALPGTIVPEEWSAGSILMDPTGQLHVAVFGNLDPEDNPPEHGILRFSPAGDSLGLYSNIYDGFAEDGFCNVLDMTMCGDDVCIHDFNCWGIKRFTVQGDFVEETETSVLRTELDFVETSVTSNDDGSRIFVTGVYEAGGRAILRLDL